MFSGCQHAPARAIYFCMLMRMKLLLFLFFVALTSPVLAQRIVSPEVGKDGRVTFRLKAPNAKDVKLRCEGVPESLLQKDDSGVWSFTTGPLEPDIYVYSFQVDGIRMIDLNNPLLKYNLLNTDSQVHVPGPATLVWEVNDVPRGQVHHHFFKSTVVGEDRDFYVYTPPGYDFTAKERYPVLYLLHGFSDDASAWSTVGCANVILDNLIARGQAKPMIIVMPLGYGSLDYVWGRGSGRGDASRQSNLEKFRESLLNEVMPRTEKAYRILAEPKAHAIAGLSMGGSEALSIGLNALDRFAYVAGFSSGGGGTNFAERFPKLDEQANQRLQLLWLSCGEQDGLLSSNLKFNEWLTSKDVHHTWVQTPGQHSFRVWRRNLAALAPKLF
jgi:enterochelin esterase family protein